MSRCVLDNDETGDEIVIGWDPGLHTYFAQVIESGEKEPNIWLGTMPNEYQAPEELIQAIQVYACSFDEFVLLNNLHEDKANDNERIYGISGADICE